MPRNKLWRVVGDAVMTILYTWVSKKKGEEEGAEYYAVQNKVFICWSTSFTNSHFFSFTRNHFFHPTNSRIRDRMACVIPLPMGRSRIVRIWWHAVRKASAILQVCAEPFVCQSDIDERYARALASVNWQNWICGLGFQFTGWLLCFSPTTQNYVSHVSNLVSQ